MLSKDRRDVDPITGAFRRTVQIDRRGLGSLGGRALSRGARHTALRFDEIVLLQFWYTCDCPNNEMTGVHSALPGTNLVQSRMCIITDPINPLPRPQQRLLAASCLGGGSRPRRGGGGDKRARARQPALRGG